VDVGFTPKKTRKKGNALKFGEGRKKAKGNQRGMPVGGFVNLLGWVAEKKCLSYCAASNWNRCVEIRAAK